MFCAEHFFKTMKETLINITKAYLGECQARNRYTFYAKIAQKEGYEQIAEIFLVTADQERTHAKRLFEHIQELKENNEEIKVEASAPTIYGTTIENLKAAIAGETYETTQMYPEFSKKALEEGYEALGKRLAAIAIAENNHKERYEGLLKNLEEGTTFKKKEATWWVCRECGYVHFGPEAPKECPSCSHPQSYYQVRV
jgi:rubrerythrin